MSKTRSIFFIFFITFLFFTPIWFRDKTALNANFLVSFYAPWKFMKFSDYPTGVPAKQGGGYDQLRIGYPYFSLVWDSWRHWRLPLWNPYNFSGLPLAAETQSAAFYPLHFFALLFSDTVVWNIFVVSAFVFNFIFMYLFLLEISDDHLGSIFGGFTFAFGTFFIVWIQEVVTAAHVTMWLPLSLLALLKLRSENKWWFILLASLVLAILAGYIQIAIYVFIIVAGFSFYLVQTSFKTYEMKGKYFLMVLGAFFFAFSLTMFQLIPLWEMYEFSSRTTVDMQAFLKASLLPWYAIVQFVIPDFFGNSGTLNHFGYPQGTFYEHSFTFALPALFFACLSIFNIKNWQLKFIFLLVFFLSLTFSSSSIISRKVFDVHIPVLSSSIANRLLFLPVFAIAGLSTLGISEWKKKVEKTNRLPWLLLIILGIFFLSIFLFIFLQHANSSRPFGFPPNWTTIAWRNSILPVIVLIAMAVVLFLMQRKKISKNTLVVFFIIFSILQIAYFFQKVVTFSESRLVYPLDDLARFMRKNAPDRFWAFGDGFIENNLATQLMIFSPEGYDSLVGRRYAQLLYSVGNDGRWTDQISRSDANIYRQTVTKSFKADTNRLRLLDLVSARYILYKPLPDAKPHELQNDFLDSHSMTSMATLSGISIYRNETALPRVFLAGSYIVRTKNQEILDELFNPELNLRQTVILEEPGTLAIERDSEAKAVLTTYQADYVAVRTKSQKPQWLVLTDAFYPGWRVYIDGKESIIHRIYFALRGIEVPAGGHKIEFRYLPKAFVTGCIISGVSFVLLATGTIGFYIWRKSAKLSREGA